MNAPEREHGRPIWTNKDIKKLLAEMKRSVPEEYRTRSYIGGIKTIQWEDVAVPPFSAEACQAKWGEISLKIRKMRSLTELISEAEETFTNFTNWVDDMGDKPPLQYSKRKTAVCRNQISGMRKRIKTNVSGTQDEENSENVLQVKPPHNGYNLFCKEQTMHIEGVPKKFPVAVLAKRWNELTKTEKSEYSTRCKELKRQYTMSIPVQKNPPKTEDVLLVKPPSNGYNQEQVKNIEGVPKTSYSNVLAECWKEPSEKKRREYSTRCTQKRNYVNDEHEREKFSNMPSDSEDENITDNSSEDLVFDSVEIEEEEDEDMLFIF